MSRLALVALLSLVPMTSRGDATQCTDVRVDFTPGDSLQIVVWVEKATGEYVDTIFITRKVGTYGIGNRPGRFDFNSGPPPNGAQHVDSMFPYGRRITTFPVWAHRHGISFPEVVFQSGTEDDLSHRFDQSSPESSPPFCRPLLPNADPNTCQCTDPQMWDTGTCATAAFTDKGTLSATVTSQYPPRADLTRQVGADSASVAMYAMLNPFDTVSQATPAAGAGTQVSWAVPQTLPAGDYVMWIELSREFDFNATYNATTYPSPMNIAYANYGAAYRGQPSVVYKAPFTIGSTESIATTMDYAGYGDPMGLDGAIRPPDATITTDTPGSGASRLELVADSGTMYRLRVDANPELDVAAPDMPSGLTATTVASTAATVTFVAPGDDGQIGRVSGYEIRIRANEAMTTDNFSSSMPVTASVIPVDPGQLQQIALDGLLPTTDYWVGVRAFDDCRNYSPIAIYQLTTADRQSGTVDACFVATAAYGSAMANDVELLRHFRDTLLESTVLGELAVESYYTFGPAVAGVVGESELLRATARGALAPVVTRVRGLAF